MWVVLCSAPPQHSGTESVPGEACVMMSDVGYKHDIELNCFK